MKKLEKKNWYFCLRWHCNCNNDTEREFIEGGVLLINHTQSMIINKWNRTVDLAAYAALKIDEKRNPLIASGTHTNEHEKWIRR